MSNSFPRGATVRLRAQFFDADDVVTSPSGAKAYLTYFGTNGALKTDTLGLSLSGEYWTALWDSRLSQGGIVYGHARTTDPTPVSADDFQFSIDTNLANP